MSKLKRITIFIVMLGTIISLSMPQLLVAQVGDGTGGPPIPSTSPLPPGDGTGGPPIPSTTPHPGDGTGGPPPIVPSDDEEPDDEDEDADEDPDSNVDQDHSHPPGTSGNSGNNSTSAPNEPPINLEVVDCPGVVREINAFNLPPSIYPKPNCGPGTAGNANGPTGVCTTDPNVQAYGTSLEGPPEGAIFWTMIGATNGSIGQGFGPTDFGMTGYYDNYDFTLDVQGHPGVDVGSPTGTKLYTPVGGTVINDGATGYFRHDPAGNAPHTGELLIELENGDQLLIGHMSQIDVRKGDVLQPGQYVGLSGIANGADHLHIEYRKKLAHPQGEYTALDPRDVFGCVSPTSPTPDPSASPTPGAGQQSNVQGARTEKGQVLQANAQVSPDFAYFQEEYGLDPVTGEGNIDFDQYGDNLATLRDHAVKAAPAHDIDPEIIVMWSTTETGPPYTSWEYSHCESMGGIIDPEAECPNNNWQVGYGQQYAVYHQISAGWEFLYGADNATQVQQVLQNSATMAGISRSAPSTTAAALSSESSRFWAMVMSRDQAMSAYLLAYELKSDLQNAANNGYGNRLWDFACDNGWGSAYCQGSEFRARFSNNLNAILLNWGRLGSGTSGNNQVCKVGVSATNSNCSTMEDVLGGMTVEEFTTKINENMAAYKRIAECGNVPWEMMAAIHLRETGLDPNYDGPGSLGAQGPWQIDPTGALWGSVDPYDFEGAGCAVAKGELQAKAQSGPLGRPLSQNMNPATKDDEYSIKDAFFAYNGRAGWEGNVEKGCTPALDGNPELNFDCSGYVMNNWDAQHTDMCIGTVNGPFCDTNDGVWKVYFKLHYSTYGSNGELLVYGGNCNMNNEVIGGYAAPTKAGLQINSQFFKPPQMHKGIDIANQAGDPIFALSTGEIIISGWDPNGGYYLILHIEPRGGQPEMYVYYGHLEPGSFPSTDNGPVQVEAGQHIGNTGELNVVRPDGTTGENGLTDGPHLHFDIRRQASAPVVREDHIDPCTLDIMRNSYPTLECSNSAPDPQTP